MVLFICILYILFLKYAYIESTVSFGIKNYAIKCCVGLYFVFFGFFFFVWEECSLNYRYQKCHCLTYSVSGSKTLKKKLFLHFSSVFFSFMILIKNCKTYFEYNGLLRRTVQALISMIKSIKSVIILIK